MMSIDIPTNNPSSVSFNIVSQFLMNIMMSDIMPNYDPAYLLVVSNSYTGLSADDKKLLNSLYFSH